jgi:hypothetical protein
MIRQSDRGIIRTLGYFLFIIKRYDLLGELELNLKIFIPTLFSNYDFELETNRFLNNLQSTDEDPNTVLIKLINFHLKDKNIILHPEKIDKFREVIELQPTLTLEEIFIKVYH